MKPATFKEAVVLYEGMIVNQIKKLGIRKDYEEYYQCGLIGLWHAYERFDEKKGYFPAYAVVTVRGYILERLKKEFAVQERCVCVGEYEDIFHFEDVEIRVKDFMSVLDEKEKYIIFERFCREDDGRNRFRDGNDILSSKMDVSASTRENAR